jgi:hypothetical protein
VTRPKPQRRPDATSIATLTIVLAVWQHYGNNCIEALAAATGTWVTLTHIAHHYFRGK